MNMNSYFLLLLYFGLPYCGKVYAENDHSIKRGMYPFMAFIYYSDPSVIDSTGQRFIRSAVLIRPDWLVTTALGPSVSDSDNGFPTKTLLARSGAVAIDSKFTLNEDEDEQEREIVQIVRPYNHSATQWWTTDISLMKTLLPFNMTSAVAVKTLNVKQNFDGKTCSILVYTKYGNMTEDKNLIVLFVELLPPSIENCGSHFAADTMACASDSDDNKDAMYESDFCNGNRGGPLMCENEVIGLQTYIDNNCKQPHLYQLLYAWDNFITCGIEDKCQEEQCASICDVTYKDPPITEVKVARKHLTAVHTVKPEEPTENYVITSTETVTTTTVFDKNTDTTTGESEISTLPNIFTVTMTAIDELLTPETTLMTTESTSSTVSTEIDSTETTSTETENIDVKVNSSPPTERETDLTWIEEPKIRTWPKVKPGQEKLKENEADEPPRNTSVEARRQSGKSGIKHQIRRDSSNRLMSTLHTVTIGSIVLLCL